MRRATAFLAAALLAAAAASASAPAPAQELTFFGPAGYAHPEGGTSYAVDTVVVPPYVGGPFTMRVQNGTGEERSRVDAAWIFLNDRPVASPEDFHPRVTEFGRTVQMQPGQNKLVIVIRGRPRTQLTLGFSGQLIPPQVVSLTPVNATLTLGGSTRLQLAITPVQPTDTTVPLDNSPPGIVSAPDTVIVPAGRTTVDVPVGSIAFGKAGITARLGGSYAAALVTVIPQSLQVVSIVPAAARMNVGATSTFTVNINAVQDGPKDIALSVDAAGVLEPLPDHVTVPAGQTSATFTATGKTVGDVVVTAASANGTSATTSVHVSPEPAAIESLTPSPLALQTGATGKLTVTINVAQEFDTPVSLVNDAPGVATVPDGVTIPAGAIAADIAVTAAGTAGTANVTASVNGGPGVTVAVNVSLPPPVVTSVTPGSLSLANGRGGSLTVNVSRAPSALTAVALLSSDPSIASVPQAVNIDAGAASATFAVSMNAEGQATITATLNDASAGATVTVTPAELLSLTITPPPPTAITVGQTQQFNAIGKMTAGPDQDFTTRATWSASDGSATIGVNTGLATAVSPGSPTITAAYGYTPVGSTQSVTVSQSTTLLVNAQPSLALSGPATVKTGNNFAVVTVLASVPAPAGGLTVTLTAAGTGIASIPPLVVIPEGASANTFTISGVVPGPVTLTAGAPGYVPASYAFTVVPDLFITSISPTSGPTGSLVTISGSGFDIVASNDTVSFAPGVSAPVVSATASQLVVAVPDGAVTGPIVVSTTTGSAQSLVYTVTPPAFLTVFVPNPIPTGVNGGAQVVSSVPAPATGLTVTLGMTGPAPLTMPPAVLIPAGLTTASFTFVASVPGTYQITAGAPGVTPGQATITVTQGVSITSISPTSGPVGTIVTISGGPFDAVPANNTVQFPPGAPAPVISATPTQLTVAVPAGAISGSIAVITPIGQAFSAPFTVASPTHAHITDLNATSNKTSSPVTPFVLGSNPGDAFSFVPLGDGLNGKATVVGNRLVYTATTPNFIGADSFPYRVQKTSDGSTIDGIARVRVFSTGNLNACTRNSTQALVNGVPTLTRTVAHPCAFYAETATRLVPTGAATVKYYVARPSNGAAPKAALFMVSGADLDINISGNATTGIPDLQSAGGFVVRTMQIFADAGYLVIAMNRPSDVAPTDNIDRYRISVKHAVDILNVLREENTDDLPLFIAGTSRGAMSAVATNLIATGVSISSPVTVSSGPSALYVGIPDFPILQPSFVRRPAHVLWNTDDQCAFTPPSGAQALYDSLVAAGVTAAFDVVSGGFAFPQPGSDSICGGLSLHQFLGIEKTSTSPPIVPLGAATALIAWLDSRIAALGANRHPDAASAALSTAPGTPLTIDLAPLASDPDGDPRTFLLSHLTTSLGGSVARSGSIVTYTPPAGVTTGTDYFVYAVNDDRGGVGAAVITVNIGN